jgi:chromosome segregation ATPase
MIHASAPSVAAPRTRTGEPLRIDDVGKLLDWVREGRHPVTEVIPRLLQEADTLRQRLAEAERRYARLEHEAGAMRAELAVVRGKHDRLAQRHADVTRAVAELLLHMTAAIGPLRDLAEKRGTPAPD